MSDDTTPVKSAATLALRRTLVLRALRNGQPVTAEALAEFGPAAAGRPPAAAEALASEPEPEPEPEPAAAPASEPEPAPASAPEPAPVSAPAVDDPRLAELEPQWRYAAQKVLTLGWQVFPLQDRPKPRRDRPKPSQPVPADKAGKAETDWSKRPRPKCGACRKAYREEKPKPTPEQCYARCAHRLCHGFLGASADIELVIEWARRFPKANVGVRTGPGSNLFVVDEDGETGAARLAELIAEHGDWPATTRHQTGGGTWHHLFNYPPERRNPLTDDGSWGNSAKTKLGDGLDTRGEGGYIVAPGSVSLKGPYSVDRDPGQLDPPGWVLDLVATPNKRRGERDTARPGADTPLPPAPPISVPGGVHPYARVAFEGRVAEFRAITTTGNARTNKLCGDALYLSGLANAAQPSGLTEQMVREAYTEACAANGYAAEHADWEYQLDRAITDGQTSTPTNWPPPELPGAEVDRIIAETLDSGDAEQIAALTSALGGPDAIASWLTRNRHGTGAAGVTAAPVAAVVEAPAADPPATAGGAAADPGANGAGPGGTVPPGAPAADPATNGATTNGATTNGAAPPAKPADDRIGVLAAGRDFSELRQEIQRALAVSNVKRPWLYLHGEDPVLAGRRGLQPCSVPLLVSRLADRLRFFKWTKAGSDGYEEKPEHPPVAEIGAIHADAQNLHLPEVDRVAHAPFFGPDGALQRKPGYHAAARTLYVAIPGVDIPDIPDAPTAEQVAAAKELLLVELLGDFPFAVSPTAEPDAPNAELAGAVALALTPFVRAMIHGPTPLFALDAPDARTGKGLLLAVLLLASWGREFTVTAAPSKPEEWQKQILASLRSAPVVAVFDNVGSRIESGALASAVTAWPIWTARILGVSENAQAPLPPAWACTGNNITASRENAERIVRIRMEAGVTRPGQRTGPGVTRPGQRTGWRHPHLLRWASERQGEITAALLTLVQAWIADGRPVPEDLPVMGGFEDWVSVLGSILAYHSIGGLLSNQDDLIDTLDEEGSAWSGLITMMSATPEREWGAVELVGALMDNQIAAPVDLIGVGGAHYQGRKLGAAMRAHRDRRFGDHLLRMRTLHGITTWRLERAADGAPPPPVDPESDAELADGVVVPPGPADAA